jgi:hypothetical protein
MLLKNPMIPPAIDSGTVRLVAQRLKHYATPGPDISSYPCELFGFKSLIISSVSLVVVCFNLVFVRGRVNTLCRYFSGSVVYEVKIFIIHYVFISYIIYSG